MGKAQGGEEVNVISVEPVVAVVTHICQQDLQNWWAHAIGTVSSVIDTIHAQMSHCKHTEQCQQALHWEAFDHRRFNNCHMFWRCHNGNVCLTFIILQMRNVRISGNQNAETSWNSTMKSAAYLQIWQVYPPIDDSLQTVWNFTTKN